MGFSGVEPVYNVSGARTAWMRGTRTLHTREYRAHIILAHGDRIGLQSQFDTHPDCAGGAERRRRACGSFIWNAIYKYAANTIDTQARLIVYIRYILGLCSFVRADGIYEAKKKQINARFLQSDICLASWRRAPLATYVAPLYMYTICYTYGVCVLLNYGVQPAPKKMPLSRSISDKMWECSGTSH